VDSTAALVSSFGDAEAAARLLGAADRVFERNNARRGPADEAIQAPRRRLAKERLGEAAFAAALAAGRELTLETAFREASEWLERRGAAS
jgi:hypothetical protein